ncbi:MAG TPA: hypothetical protein VKE74_33695 [Gemmataceae bacterium]|nr:hypothetical protein [Gemmataceae bacterium]
MRETHLTLPELALIAGTRAALGAGLALLLGGRLLPGERKALGWGLLLVGVVSTIPLAIDVLGKSRQVTHDWWSEMEMAPAGA